VLLEGTTRVLGQDPRSQQPVTLERLGRGATGGGHSVWCGVPSGQTVIASTEALALTLPSYTFLQYLDEYPEFGRGDCAIAFTGWEQGL
jgi:ATP-binding cassette subfamily B protein